MAGLPGVCPSARPTPQGSQGRAALLRNCANDRHAQRADRNVQDRHPWHTSPVKGSNESSVAVKAMDVFFDVMGVSISPEFSPRTNQLLGGKSCPEARDAAAKPCWYRTTPQTEGTATGLPTFRAKTQHRNLRQQCRRRPMKPLTTLQRGRTLNCAELEKAPRFVE